jgi:hypothetical protein
MLTERTWAMGAVRIRTPLERVAREYIVSLSARRGTERRPEVAARGLYPPHAGIAKKGANAVGTAIDGPAEWRQCYSSAAISSSERPR